MYTLFADKLASIGRDMPCCLIRDVAQSTQDSTTSWHNPGCQSGNEHTPPYYYCMKCDSMYCSECWAQNQKHKSRGHEETIPNDAITVHTALRVMLQEFTLLQEAIGQLHTRGAAHQWEGSSEWFGVSAKNDAGQCLLSEGPAYEDIMLESPVSCSSVTYPGLVSFVGETGSGKSTLISLLIKFSSSPLSNLFRTPAVGAAGSLNSTSSNVHLYADPETFLTDRPMLYVDCEGMDGDEIPAGMRYKQDSNGVDFEYAQSFTHINTQKIQWGEKMEDRNQLTRKYVTKTLFPRILYIFSDVVVYIPFNRIRLEDTLLHLVEWAHNATEQSYNKPVLPCAIIAFMNRDGQVNPKDYDIDAAKHTVFDKLKDFRNIKGLQSYVEYWESNKQTIDSVEALLRCYYASVSVVNFPNGMLPTKMHEQSTKLYSEIHRAFRESQQRRKTAWMQLNAAALPQYVRKAFTHFASNYTAPFDFSDAWVDLHQISFNFQGSIFNLATKVGLLKRWRGMEVWTEVAEFVASCLLLNCCRHKLPLSLEPKPVLPKQLWDQCKRAADQYWKIYWPCRYTEDGWGSCVNGPNGHVHHQLYDKHRNRINKKVANGPHIPCDNMGSQQLQKEFQTQVEKALAGLAPQAGVLDDTTESLKKRPSPEGEMQLWEAARATSAAPTYFAPFAHKGTKQVYLDGGLWHNNPIKIAEAESKAIWPANKQPHPDIILSIGAGYHKTESIATIGEQRYLEQVVTETRTDGSGSTWRPDSGAYLRFLLDIALSQITNSLSCERIWHEWLEARAPDSRSERRYRRLNVEFGRPVKMDDASGDGIKACQDAVAHRDPQEFQDIADQLIASCFFFSFGAEDIIKFSNGSYRCSGNYSQLLFLSP
ncbi:hypothetical protein ACKLNR_014153 [Fusarium oxysporum f. sp. zingiberi]